jgi:ABC-2 type transport system ATP-binding protein
MNAPTSSTGLALATQAVTKRYGRRTALDGIDLRVPDGAVYVLVGANGAGKSTAFKLAMNLERPDSGTVEVLGMDASGRGPEVRAQVGYVPEHPVQAYRWMTCGRLLQHVAAYYPGWDGPYAERLSRGLGLRLEQRAGTLSKGESRRLQLVLAMAHRPRLLLLDEPTDGLDPMARNKALALLTEHLADFPTTVLMSTHHVHEVDSLADHVGVLRGGRLVAQLPREELLRTVRQYRLEVPEGWEAPVELQSSGLRRSAAGRLVQWTFVGEERAVSERLTLAGAKVREVTALGLEDAALAFLPEELTS